ncbi:ABC transporter substrate-binding protein [Chloroflexota bacterium]
MKKKIIWLMMSCLMVVALVLASCGPAVTEEEEVVPGEEESKYGGTLRVALIADNNTVDPAFITSSADYAFTQITYDNLTWRQHDLTLKPMLATSWEANEDATVFTFHLREGVKFHHGKVFNADDVVFTFERILDPDTGSVGRASLDSISKVTKIDDYTVQFEVSSPNAFLPDAMSITQARILPSDINVDRFATEEFGTGPFICTEYLPGERAVFERNPDYWDEGLPYLDEVVFYYMPEPETRVEALKTASVDVYHEVGALALEGLEATAGVVISETSSATYINMAMIETIPPFDNKLVRQALQAATNREEILQVAMFGRGVIGNDTTIPPTDPHYDSTQEIPPYDIEKAKQLLADAGYPDGIDVTLHTSTIGQGMVETAVAFKESAEPAGIRVTIKQHPSDSYWSNVWMVEPFTMVSWNGRPPDQALSLVYLCGTAWNETQMCIPELDELIIRARGETDFEQRKQTYAEVQRILIDDASRIIPVFRPVFEGLRDNVRGVKAHPNNWLYLHEAWLADSDS